MNLQRVLNYIQRWRRKVDSVHVSDEPQMISNGWDKYASSLSERGAAVLYHANLNRKERKEREVLAVFLGDLRAFAVKNGCGLSSPTGC